MMPQVPSQNYLSHCVPCVEGFLPLKGRASHDSTQRDEVASSPAFNSLSDLSLPPFLLPRLTS
eukprot:235934-Hanusia_phi.AAC.1